MNIDLENMRAGERQELLSQLLKMHVGAVPYGDDDWCLSFEGKVQPGCAQTICAAPQMAFQPRKLIIVETAQEIIERTHEYKDEPRKRERTRKGWFGREVVEEYEEMDRIIARVTEQRHFFTRARSLWAVTGAFVGNKIQFPAYGTIPGDAFGLDGTLLWTTPCQEALNIALTVKNLGTVAADFQAVLLGKRLESKKSEAESVPYGEGAPRE